VPNVFLPQSSLDLLDGLPFLGFLGSLVVAQVYRYRWVSGPVERQQTKWVVFGLALALVGFATLITLAYLVLSPKSMGPLAEMAAVTFAYGFIALILLSIGVAILRSGLYEIDTLINRTLVYVTLTGMLIALYFGGIVVLQRILVLLTGEKSTVAVVASTLLIAAVFTPLRRRIQGFIDRRFYRKKYDAAKTLQGFSEKLRDETDLEALSGDLVSVVRETMQPAHVSLWLRSRTPKGE
jgi:hypothetical protein